jgi:hypothetical protein
MEEFNSLMTNEQYNKFIGEMEEEEEGEEEEDQRGGRYQL